MDRIKSCSPFVRRPIPLEQVTVHHLSSCKIEQCYLSQSRMTKMTSGPLHEISRLILIAVLKWGALY